MSLFKNLKKDWWKYLAIILVFYSLVVGMMVPLRNGIISEKSALTLKIGQKKSLGIDFYNSDYKKEKATDITARIRLDSHKAICADEVKITNSKKLSLNFDIPTIDLKTLKSPFPFLEIGSPKNDYVFASIYLLEDSTAASNTDEKFCEATYLAPNNSFKFPFLNILEETIRNLFYHVPMWFGMMLLLLVSMIYSVMQLRSQTNNSSNSSSFTNYDNKAKAFAGVGVLYGILGVTTGAIWAKHTWGEYWSWDVKQNTSAIALLIYIAYFILRSSFDDADKKARISAVYNIFAFANLIPLLYIIPRMVDSLHPGAEGNPAFSSYDLDSNMRLLFYPSVIGWVLFGVWIAQIWIRVDNLWLKNIEKNN
jgi:heme exporter protein C